VSGRTGTTYATALIELTAETGNIAEVGAELRTVAAGLLADADVEAFLANRHIGRAVKRRILGGVLSGTGDERLYALIMILAGRGRLGHLRQIASEYQRLEEAAQGIQRAVMTSAAPLGQADLQRIQRALERRLQKTLVVEARVDPSLIAGLRVESQGVEYELSVDGVLRGLAARLGARKPARG
jgi:F-type H+-transporting ATPase subunit delta